MESSPSLQTAITLENIRAAREIVYRTLKPTPLMEYPLLNEELGAHVFLKHENHQATGAFKIRGSATISAGVLPA